MAYKKFLLLLLLSCTMGAWSVVSVAMPNDDEQTIAQSDYRPLTSWPYLFSEFQTAELHTDLGDSIDAKEIGFPMLYNIHLKGSLLHYANPTDGRVHHAMIMPSQCIIIKDKKFVIRDGKVMELVARIGGEKDSKVVELLLQTDGNWQQLFRYQGAAYGMEMTASANEGLYNSELVGLDRPVYEVMCQQRADGREILLQDVYYVASASTLYGLQNGEAKVEKVSRKVLENVISDKQLQKDFRNYCNDNEINFRNGKDIRKAFSQIDKLFRR